VKVSLGTEEYQMIRENLATGIQEAALNLKAIAGGAPYHRDPGAFLKGTQNLTGVGAKVRKKEEKIWVLATTGI
jgi:hypothetical protein